MARLTASLCFKAGTLALGILLYALCPTPAAADRSDPAKVVKAFHATLLQVMKNAKTLGYKGRYGALAPAIGEAFNLRIMSRLVAGRRHWKRFSKSERDSFVTAFSTLVTATYAHRFDGYSGQSFRVISSSPLRPGTVLVKASIVGTKDGETKLNYLLRQFDDGWRSIDVYLKGSISEVAAKRSEYATILRKRGVRALVEKIRKKTASFAAEADRKRSLKSEEPDA